MTQEEQNVAVIRKLNELVNTQNYDAMDELFSDSFVDHNYSWKIRSLADLKKAVADAHQDFQLHNTIKEVVAVDDMVTILLMMNGRQARTMFEVAPANNEIGFTTFEIYRFKDGRIAERWVLSDMIGLMRQVGVNLPIFQA